MKNSKILLIAINTLWALPAFSTPIEDDANFFKERDSAAYVQKGLRSGSFMYLPELSLTNEYNSNIYMRDKALGVTDSYVAHYKPGVDVRSDWTRHSLGFGLNTDIAQYATQPNNNDYQDVMTHIDGKLDMTRNGNFYGNFAYNRLHENRGSPDQIGGMTPTVYDTKIFDGFYSEKFNRVALKTGLDATRYDYEDVQSSLGTTLKMSTRDRWEYKPLIRLGYEIQPGYEAFAKFEYKIADYDTNVLPGGAGLVAINRNSNGYNATAGMGFDLTDLLTGDISAGYIERSYDDVRLAQVSGVNGFLNLKYRPTKLTTVLARIGRDVAETTQQGVAGILSTTASLSAEHELYRNVLLKVGGNVGQMGYQGYDTTAANRYNRDDLMYGGTASAKYLLNRNLSTDLAYTYSSRDSNYAYSNFVVNQLMLNLRGQF